MRHLILILIGLALASGGAYFVGYDHGFKKAATTQELSVYDQSAVGDAARTMANIVGMWQSTEDPKFTREIRNDGVAVDRYNGESGAEGLWMVFTKEIPDQSFEGAIEDGAVYLSIALGEDEKYYFKVIKADGKSLELVYLDRGGVLSFSRISSL